MLRSTYFASAAIAALLALPAAALAQSSQAPTTAATTPSAPTAAASPMSANAVPGGNAEQRVEAHIRQLHAQLRITSAEQPQWERFANTMRENARTMDQEFVQRMQQFPTMNALENMQSYERIADMHAEDLHKLVPAFENLYSVMPEQQKRLTDQVFRENAEANAQKHMETGSAAR